MQRYYRNEQHRQAGTIYDRLERKIFSIKFEMEWPHPHNDSIYFRFTGNKKKLFAKTKLTKKNENNIRR